MCVCPIAIGGGFTVVMFDEPPIVAWVMVTPTVIVIVSPLGPMAVVVVVCSPAICLSTRAASFMFRVIL